MDLKTLFVRHEGDLWSRSEQTGSSLRVGLAHLPHPARCLTLSALRVLQKGGEHGVSPFVSSLIHMLSIISRTPGGRSRPSGHL